MTYDPEKLKKLGRQHQRLRDQLDAIRPELAAEIRAAAEAGMRPVDLVKATGYTRDGIRKLLLSADRSGEGDQ
jgi:hypothetical protein